MRKRKYTYKNYYKEILEDNRKYNNSIGLVMISVWVPEKHKNEILNECARLRNEHKLSVGAPLRKEQ